MNEAQEEVNASVRSVSTNKKRVALKLLRDAGLIKASARRKSATAGGEPDAQTFERLANDYREMSEQDREKLERMIAYAQSALCRWKILLTYFRDDLEFERCEHCDNCLAPPPAPPVESESDAAAIDVRKPKFSPGQPVRVRRYGRGNVVAASADEVLIEFADGAKRKFVPGYVRATRV